MIENVNHKYTYKYILCVSYVLNFLFLPSDYNYKIHDVPHISQVTARMEDKTLCQNLEAGLDCKDSQEVGFCGFLLKRE